MYKLEYLFPNLGLNLAFFFVCLWTQQKQSLEILAHSSLWECEVPLGIVKFTTSIFLLNRNGPEASEMNKYHINNKMSIQYALFMFVCWWWLIFPPQEFYPFIEKERWEQQASSHLWWEKSDPWCLLHSGALCAGV